MTSLNLVDIAATSSGLTTATTAYAAGDTLGALMSWDMGDQDGLIVSAVLTDISDVIGAVDLYLFNASVTFGTDNAAPTISDADVIKCIGKIEFPTPDDLGANRVAVVDSLSIGWHAASGTTIYGGLVTRTANAVFADGATSLQVRLLGSKDV